MRRRPRLLLLILVLSITSYSCQDDPTTPAPPPGPQGDPLAHLWSKRFGDANLDEGRSVATDASGNILLTGRFAGLVDFGGGDLATLEYDDIFVAKFDSAGNHVWSAPFGGTDFQKSWSVTADLAGNVIVTGGFHGAINFGGIVTTSAGEDDIFVVKFDPAGNHLWSKQFGNASSQEGRSVATDGSGNILIAGCLQGAVDFGGGMLTSGGRDDMFIAKLDAAGNHLWSKPFGDASSQFGRSVRVDPAGNVYLVGHFAGTVNFGGGVLTSGGSTDICVAKFDAAGNHLWSKGFGYASEQPTESAAVDGSGNLVLAGSYRSLVNFGGGILTSAGFYDVYVAKFDSTGNHVWSKRFGDANGQYAKSVAVDASGNVFVVGHFENTMDFGGGMMTSVGRDDVFIAKFDPTGTLITCKRFGDVNFENGFGVAVDGSGDVIVTGYFDDTVDFGGGPLSSAGGWDIFLVKFTAAP